MKKITGRFSTFLLSAVVLIACTDKKDIPTAKPAELIVDKNWQFETTPMWEDNFNTGTAPDLSKWTYETGGSGWGNNELQYYTSGANASVTGGNLVITAKKEAFGGRDYTSTRMITKGKGDFLYGRFEVRAKLPKGRGTWPAIWMLHSDAAYGNWPASGEIDIMEHVGFDPNKIHASVHTSAYNHLRGTQKTASKVIPTATDDFHKYRIDWTPYAVRGYIDDVQYFEFVNGNTGFTTWPFNKRFFLILNVAVGGDWGGAQGIDNTAFPTSMVVDYVKVFKLIEQ
ncbi:family 16 glycosylhydrolase [Ferruginibacter yonginensis]|uniref:Family 16 glycosylhydrolase n=1 Tax=Ferruginibacter yonginensis TaxID=1310416 RepID=A0ABV8QVD7_9BACT